MTDFTGESDRGSGSIQTLTVLLFLSAIMVGLTGVINRVDTFERRYIGKMNLERELETECRQVVEILRNNGSPEVDSPKDFIWDYINDRNTAGIEVTLEDISSRIGRDNHPEIFDGKSWPDEFYTDYGWVNGVLNDGAEGYPLTNDMPLFNVYFTDDDILEEILSQPYEGKVLENWEPKLRAIQRKRDDGALDEARLVEILDEKGKRKDYYLSYLGVTTWFWRIEAKKKGFSHILIVARLPIENDREATLGKTAVYQIIQTYRE